MKNVIKMSLAAAVMMTVGTVSAQAADGINIFENVKVKGEIRPRYEMVDAEDNGAGNANAMTNRLVLGVGADISGTDWLSVYGEMTDVHSLNDDNYNSTDNGNPNNKQTVVDPEQTRLTQAYIDIKANGVLLRSGRQMINLDNQRYVGAVGWRQMPQTFDAFLLAYNGVENLNLAAVYVTQVNTVKAGAADSADTETVLLNASYKVSDAVKVTAYGYLIGSTHDTYGIAVTGKPKLGDGLSLNYRAEYATQTDATMETESNGKPDADADYLRLDLGMNMNGILAGVGYEVLSGANASGSETNFTTPLATLHAHNGWADVFLGGGGSPAGGLEDLSVNLGYKAKGFGLLKAVYHDFAAESSGGDYGTELDVIYKNKIPGFTGLSGMIKYADFSEDNAAYVDTQKVWVMLDYKFSN